MVGVPCCIHVASMTDRAGAAPLLWVSYTEATAWTGGDKDVIDAKRLKKPSKVGDFK